MKKIILYFILPLIVTVVVFIFLFNMFFKNEKDKYIALVKKATIYESIYGIGTIKAEKSFKLSSGVVSTISNLFVKEGDIVKKGTKLVTTDETTSFYAPFTGTITSLNCKIGETIFAQTLILTLVDLTDRYLVVSLEQKGIIKVKINQSAVVNFDSMRNVNFYGKVESIYSTENDFLVRIKMEKLPPQILPGMTADVAINVRKKENVFIIPAHLIKQNKILVQHDNEKPKLKVIKIGLVDGEFAEIIADDLAEGDKIYNIKS